MGARWGFRLMSNYFDTCFFINVLKYIVLVVFLRHFNKYIPALECHLSRVCHNYREQRWNWVTFCDQGIQLPGDPVDPVTLFYNELQMSTYV